MFNKFDSLMFDLLIQENCLVSPEGNSLSIMIMDMCTGPITSEDAHKNADKY